MLPHMIDVKGDSATDEYLPHACFLLVHIDIAAKAE